MMRAVVIDGVGFGGCAGVDDGRVDLSEGVFVGGPMGRVVVEAPVRSAVVVEDRVAFGAGGARVGGGRGGVR